MVSMCTAGRALDRRRRTCWVLASLQCCWYAVGDASDSHTVGLALGSLAVLVKRAKLCYVWSMAGVLVASSVLIS